jgi:hypothetical protein
LNNMNQSAKFDVRFNGIFSEHKPIKSESLRLDTTISESRRPDTRFHSLSTESLHCQTRKNLQVPIKRKQRPNSAQTSSQASQWQESGERNKFLSRGKRPASAKQPEKQCSLLDGLVLDNFDSCAGTSHDQLNSKEQARKKIIALVSTNMQREYPVQTKSKFRFDLKNEVSLTTSIEKKGQ